MESVPLRRPMVIVLAATVMGIWTSHHFSIATRLTDHVELVLKLVCLGMLAFLSMMSIFARSSLFTHPVSVFVLAGGCAFASASIQRGSFEKQTMARFAPRDWEPVVFEGVVDSIPKFRPNLFQFDRENGPQKDLPKAWQTLFLFRVTHVRDGFAWRRFPGRTQMTLQFQSNELFPGDRVQIYGHWQAVPAASNPGQFDLQDYYSRQGIAARTRVQSREQVVPLGKDEQWRLDRWLGRFGMQGNQSIHRYVGDGQASLCAALALGQREQIEWELRESLLATGTVHMLAISGLHVEMVAMSAYLMLALLGIPRRVQLVVVASLVISYAILCGSNPPVVRATILVVAVCASRWIYRPVDSINLLAFAGVCLLVCRPALLQDVGTQLSFLAVASLMLSTSFSSYFLFDRSDPLRELVNESASPRSRRWTYGISRARQMIVPSIEVWLITAPLVMSSFHVLSPAAIVLNVVLWPFLLVTLLSGFGLVLFGSWVPLGGFVFGSLCTLAVSVMQSAIGFVEALPLSHFWMPAPPSWCLWLFYGSVFMFYIVVGKGPRRSRWFIPLMSVLILAIVGVASFGNHTGPTTAVAKHDPDGHSDSRHSDSSQPWDAGQSIASIANAGLAKSEPRLVVCFLDVGHGTSVLIQTPNGKTILYDAGRLGDPELSYSSIVSALWAVPTSTLDCILVSHADSDHFNALPGILKRFQVRQIATTQRVVTSKSSDVVSALEFAKRKGSPVTTVLRGDQLLGYGCKIDVLHPIPDWYADSDNADSCCLRLSFAGRTVLLPGDLEKNGLESLLSQPAQNVDVLMAPHHGSLAEDPDRLLRWCRPEYIAISGGKRSSTPRVHERFGSYGGLVASTHNVGAIRFTIDIEGRIASEHWQKNRWVMLR